MGRSKRFKINRIRANHSYTLAELADACSVHPRSTQFWKRQGMPVLDDTKKPLLVMGYDALCFLKERIKKRQHPLKADQFYCPRCRGARKSDPLSVRAERTGKRLGRATEQVIIRGRCDTCDCAMVRLSSNKETTKQLQNGPLESQPKRTLTETENPCVITDIAR